MKKTPVNAQISRYCSKEKILWDYASVSHLAGGMKSICDTQSFEYQSDSEEGNKHEKRYPS